MADSIPKTQQSLEIKHNTIAIAGMDFPAFMVSAKAGPTHMQQKLQLIYIETIETTSKMPLSINVVLW